MVTENSSSIPRLLVIDDNPAIHEDFRKILVSSDDQQDLADAALAFLGDDAGLGSSFPTLEIELDSAHQGEEGYKKVVEAVRTRHPYTLVFCDMRMPPGWDGLTTIEKIFEADPNTQVVICSAYSDNTWGDISERLGLSDRLLILKKPFDTAEVLQMAVALIEKRRLIDAANIKQEELEQVVEERTRNLELSRSNSERLLTAIDSIMLRTDADGIVRRWNSAATDIFGVDPADAVGRPVDSLPIKWEDGSALSALTDTKDQSKRRLEMRFIDAEENSRVIGFSSYPVYDGHEFSGSLILGADLTENRLLEQQLHNALKLESVGQLAAGVAHEINTPMQYIGDNLEYVKTKFDKLIAYVKSSIELLEAAQEQSFEPERVEEMQASAKKLKLTRLFEQVPEALSDSIEGVAHVSRIVRAMKELSHPGSDEKSPVDINRALETTLTVSANEWKYVADIEKDFEPDLEPVLGFPGELNQVFLNLIVNAAQAIADVTEDGDKGKIILRTKKSKTFVRVEIEDTGGGIPDRIRERIFDPFFTTKAVGKGTGQGLAIAHSAIVQKHAGRITFEVAEGVGTTFIIELPIENHLADSLVEDPQGEALVALV